MTLFDMDDRPVEGGHVGGAIFSPCRTWRYELWRTWGEGDRRVLFVMLNPSTADERVLDPTLRRCRQFATSWGFDGMVIRNLFAYRATDPKDLLTAADPVGPDNDKWLAHPAGVTRTIVGWGASHHALTVPRAREVMRLLGRTYCLGLTKEGMPWHPLHLARDRKPVPYRLPRRTP